MSYPGHSLGGGSYPTAEKQSVYFTASADWANTFPRGICPKVNVIARLEYELAYYDSAVHRFNNYTTRTPNEGWWEVWEEVDTPELIGQMVRVTILRFEGSSGRDSVGRGQHSSNRLSGISSRTIDQSTIPSLSQTIWPRWASRQFLTAPIVQTLLPVTFGYSLSSEAVVMRQLRRWTSCDEGSWHAHTRGLPKDVGTVQVYSSRRRLLRSGLEFHVCTTNKSAHTKKVWKLI